MTDTSHYYAQVVSWKDYIIAYCREHSAVIMMVLMLVFRLVKSYIASVSPIQEVDGSLVQTVKSADEWNAKVKKALEEDKIIVVDFFAAWCPPCRKAAPIFAQLSKEHERAPVVFLKIDVDAARDVAVDQNIGSLPTFRFYRKGPDGKLLQVESIEGWHEKRVKAAIELQLTLGNQRVSKKDD